MTLDKFKFIYKCITNTTIWTPSDPLTNVAQPPLIDERVQIEVGDEIYSYGEMWWGGGVYGYTVENIYGIIEEEEKFIKIKINPPIKLYRCIFSSGGIMREFADIRKFKVNDVIQWKKDENTQLPGTIKKILPAENKWDYMVEYDEKTDKGIKEYFVNEKDLVSISDVSGLDSDNPKIKSVEKNEVISVIGHVATNSNRLYALTHDGKKGFVSKTFVSKISKQRESIFKELPEILIEPIPTIYTCMHRSRMREGVETGENQTESKHLIDIEVNDRVRVIGRAQENPNRFFVRYEKSGGVFEGFVTKTVSLDKINKGIPWEEEYNFLQERPKKDGERFLSAMKATHAFITDTDKINNVEINDIRFNHLPFIYKSEGSPGANFPTVHLVDGSAKIKKGEYDFSIGSKFIYNLHWDPTRGGPPPHKPWKETGKAAQELISKNIQILSFHNDLCTNKTNELIQIIEKLVVDKNIEKNKVGNYLDNLVNNGSYFINTHSAITGECFTTNIPIIVQGTVGETCTWIHSQLLLELGPKLFNLDMNKITDTSSGAMEKAEKFSKIHLPGSVVNNMAIDFFQGGLNVRNDNYHKTFEDYLDLHRFFIYNYIHSKERLDSMKTNFKNQYYKEGVFESGNDNTFYHKGSGLFPLNMAKEYMYGLNVFKSDDKGGLRELRGDFMGRFATPPTIQYREEDIIAKQSKAFYGNLAVPPRPPLMSPPSDFVVPEEYWTLYKKQEKYKKLWNDCNLIPPEVYNDTKSQIFTLQNLCDYLEKNEFKGVLIIAGCRGLLEEERESLHRVTSLANEDSNNNINKINITLDFPESPKTIKEIFQQYGNIILSLSESSNTKKFENYKSLMNNWHSNYENFSACHNNGLNCSNATPHNCMDLYDPTPGFNTKQTEFLGGSQRDTSFRNKSMEEYKNKYLKYKNKYLKYKNKYLK